MKALTLHQPWASLVALGIKTIETRSWATSYRGPLAIHAGLRRPSSMHLPPLAWGRGQEAEEHNRQTWLVIDTITDPAFKGMQPQGKRIPKRAQTPTLFYPHAGPHGRAHKSGTPATEQGTAVHLPLGAIVATCNLVDIVPMVDRLDSTVSDYSRRVLLVLNGRLTLVQGGTETDVTDQAPYGDFRPGRFAWLLDHIRPLRKPTPARGRQRLWNWEPPA